MLNAGQIRQQVLSYSSSFKFHVPSCSSADDIKAKNRKDVDWSRDKVISEGYVPCKRCDP